MRRFTTVVSLGIAILFSCSEKILADFIFSIEPTPFANDSAIPQRLSLFLAWDGVGRSDVVGINLFTEIRTLQSSTVAPIFGGAANTLQGFGYSSEQPTGGTFQTSAPTIWDTLLPTNLVSASGAVPELSNPRRATVNVLSSNLVPFEFDSVAANTPLLVAQYQLNTQGVSNERFQFFIGLEGGASTDIIFSDGDSVPAGANLSIDIGTVPEGNYLFLLSIAAGQFFFRRRSRPAIQITVSDI